MKNLYFAEIKLMLLARCLSLGDIPYVAFMKAFLVLVE